MQMETICQRGKQRPGLLNFLPKGENKMWECTCLPVDVFHEFLCLMGWCVDWSWCWCVDAALIFWCVWGNGGVWSIWRLADLSIVLVDLSKMLVCWCVDLSIEFVDALRRRFLARLCQVRVSDNSADILRKQFRKKSKRMDRPSRRVCCLWCDQARSFVVLWWEMFHS